MDIKTIDDYVLMVLSEGRKWNPNSKLAPRNCGSLEEFVVKNLVAAEEKIAQLEEELKNKEREHQWARKIFRMANRLDQSRIQRLKEKVAFLEKEINQKETEEHGKK